MPFPQNSLIPQLIVTRLESTNDPLLKRKPPWTFAGKGLWNKSEIGKWSVTGFIFDDPLTKNFPQTVIYEIIKLQIFT